MCPKRDSGDRRAEPTVQEYVFASRWRAAFRVIRQTSGASAPDIGLHVLEVILLCQLPRAPRLADWKSRVHADLLWRVRDRGPSRDRLAFAALLLLPCGSSAATQLPVVDRPRRRFRRGCCVE